MPPLLAAVLLAQAKPWTPPPTTLPKSFIEATAFLLAHGMGDPRGGEYREATGRISNEWEPPRFGTVHGWVKAGRVVTTSGLTLPVERAGGPADLDADVAQRLSGRSSPNARGQSYPIYEANSGWRLLLGAELLAIGRADLAETVAGRPERPEVAMLDSFLIEWFHQAVAAHEAGRDAEVSVVGGALLRERPAFEAEVRRLSGPRRTTEDQGRDLTKDELFPFLDILPGVVADSNRRLAHPRAPLDLDALKKRPQAERVRALVDHLDDVAARQWTQPGSVPLASDPIVVALATEDTAAVPTLLDTIEKDDRLTRSVDFERDFIPNRSPKTVREAAYAAFSEIVGTELHAFSAEWADVAGLRTLWAKIGHLSPEERWFVTLADDAAGERRWMEAAERLFAPNDVRVFGEGWTQTPKRDPRKPLPPVRAEALRGRTNPSLSDLLARRTVEILDRQEYGPRYFLRSALILAVDSARWSPDASLPTLRNAIRRAMSVGRDSLDALQEPFAEAVELWGQIGGSDAWDEYTDWTTQVRVPPTPFDTDAFRPLLRHHETSKLREALHAVFVAPDSSWSLATRGRKLNGYPWLEQIVISPLLDDPVFFKGVLQALDDRSVVGDVILEASDSVYFHTPTGGFSRGDDPSVLRDPLRPPFGSARPARVCDMFATTLARLRGAPRYRPYWPEREKDVAIDRLRAFLSHHAGRIEALLPPLDAAGYR